MLKRVGDCNQCGDCCRFTMLPVPNEWEVSAGAFAWLAMHGIELFESKAFRFRMAKVPMSCMMLGPDGLCTIHDKRPDTCRAWPNRPIDVAIVPTCTFKFEEVPDDQDR